MSRKTAVPTAGHHGKSDRRESAGEGIWHAVEDLLDRAKPEGALYHGLGGLEAQRLRRLGRPVPTAFQQAERAAIVVSAMTAPLLKRVRNSCEGPLVLLKGPEVARLYPPGGRLFGDLDLLTARADGVQRELLATGFILGEAEATSVDDHHHLFPLVLETLPLTVEVHKHVNWPVNLQPPRLAEIFEASIPSRLGVDGVLTPSATHHALILAAHSWRHQPLRLVRDLLDIALVSAEADEHDIETTAAAWGLGPVWRTTRTSIDFLFYGGRKTVPLRTWARHLESVRDRTVFEWHLVQWASPFWESPVRQALLNTGSVLRGEVSPEPGETWRGKITRSARAARRAAMPLTHHQSDLDTRPRANGEKGQ